MTIAKTVLEKFNPKLSEAAFSTVFRDNFLLEVVSDIISGVVDDQVGMDVCVKFGDSKPSCF